MFVLAYISLADESIVPSWIPVSFPVSQQGDV